MPFSWACKKQTAVSHSGTKAEVIPLDTAPRIEGLLALTLLDVVINVLELPARRARGDPSRHFQAKTFIERQRGILRQSDIKHGKCITSPSFGLFSFSKLHASMAIEILQFIQSMASWDNIAKWTSEKPTKRRRSKGRRNLEDQWSAVHTTAGGSITIQTRQHLELGQAHRARMYYQSVQQATASQAGSSFYASTVTSKEMFSVLRTRSRILRSERSV